MRHRASRPGTPSGRIDGRRTVRVYGEDPSNRKQAGSFVESGPVCSAFVLRAAPMLYDSRP
jgi:hypothetical protein